MAESVETPRRNLTGAVVPAVAAAALAAIGALVLVMRNGNDTLAAALRAALSQSWDHEAISRWGQSRSWQDVADEVLEQVEAIFGSG